MNDHFLFTEKYRPKTIADTILPADLKNTFQQFVDQKNIPNMILAGSAGVGKTTVARAMLEQLGCDYIVINGSMNGNIDTLRNEILNFASSMSLSGGRKYVILDECLEENTLVHILRNGKKMSIPISLLDEKNDLVKSFNIQTNKIEWKPFYLFDKGNKETLEIEFENNEIIVCTLDHKWYVLDENDNPLVVKASELYKYNYVLTEGEYLNAKGIDNR